MNLQKGVGSGKAAALRAMTTDNRKRGTQPITRADYAHAVPAAAQNAQGFEQYKQLRGAARSAAIKASQPPLFPARGAQTGGTRVRRLGGVMKELMANEEIISL